MQAFHGPQRPMDRGIFRVRSSASTLVCLASFVQPVENKNPQTRSQQKGGQSSIGSLSINVQLFPKINTILSRLQLNIHSFGTCETNRNCHTFLRF
ncbi:unnamed protein product [Ixodes persulcatus]